MINDNRAASKQQCMDVFARLGAEGLRLLHEDVIYNAWLSYGIAGSPCEVAIHKEWVRRKEDPAAAKRLDEKWLLGYQEQ